jgi:hypothetical protein
VHFAQAFVAILEQGTLDEVGGRLCNCYGDICVMNEATQTLPIPAAPSAPDRWRSGITTNFCLLVLIILVAAILRLHGIASKSFWLDEGISVEIARLPWRQFFYVLRRREINMALYYLLLHFWLALGSTEGFIRGLSVLFSVATVPVLYALGARLFGRGVAARDQRLSYPLCAGGARLWNGRLLRGPGHVATCEEPARALFRALGDLCRRLCTNHL